MKKYLWMSSAAVVIAALRIKLFMRQDFPSEKNQRFRPISVRRD